MNDPLTFISRVQQGELGKTMPMSVDEVSSPTPLPAATELKDLTLTQQPAKVADLYHGYLYTVVPKEFDIDQAEITPEVQGFHPRKVWLWDNYDSLFKFDESLWKKIKVKVPRELLGHQLFKAVGDVYTIDRIPIGWSVLQPNSPQYVE